LTQALLDFRPYENSRDRFYEACYGGEDLGVPATQVDYVHNLKGCQADEADCREDRKAYGKVAWRQLLGISQIIACFSLSCGEVFFRK
jgi:hypothetical protein